MTSYITSEPSNMGNPKGEIPWYLDTLERVPPLAQRVLQEYAGIKEDELKGHIENIVCDMNSKCDHD